MKTFKSYLNAETGVLNESENAEDAYNMHLDTYRKHLNAAARVPLTDGALNLAHIQAATAHMKAAIAHGLGDFHESAQLLSNSAHELSAKAGGAYNINRRITEEAQLDEAAKPMNYYHVSAERVDGKHSAIVDDLESQGHNVVSHGYGETGHRGDIQMLVSSKHPESKIQSAIWKHNSGSQVKVTKLTQDEWDSHL